MLNTDRHMHTQHTPCDAVPLLQWPVDILETAQSMEARHWLITSHSGVAVYINSDGASGRWLSRQIAVDESK